MVSRFIFYVVLSFIGRTVASECPRMLKPSRSDLESLGFTAFCHFSTLNPYSVYTSGICYDGVTPSGTYCGRGSCDPFSYYCDEGCLESGDTEFNGDCGLVHLNRERILDEYETLVDSVWDDDDDDDR